MNTFASLVVVINVGRDGSLRGRRQPLRCRIRRDGLTTIDKLAFSKEAGDLLIELGYEKYNAWAT